MCVCVCVCVLCVCVVCVCVCVRVCVCPAPCVTKDLTDCDECESALACYNFDFRCNCYSDCFTDGDCCSDISLTQNCFGECESFVS